MKKIITTLHEYWKRLGFSTARFLARITTKVLWLFVAIIVFVALAVVFKEYIGKFVGDMISPVGMNQYLHGAPGGSWLTAVAYLLGLFVFSGIFISLITNYLREAGKRYRFGTLNTYHWQGHALFLGYDDLMIGTLKQASRQYPRVVVALPGNVIDIRDILKKYLDGETMKRVELVQCNPTDIADLNNRACIVNAARIYIIGMADEPTHDAQNLKSLAIIADHLMPMLDDKCSRIMVYLRNQSTFTLLQRQGFKAINLWKTIGKEATVAEQTFLDRHCEYFNFHCDKALRLLSATDGMHLCHPSAQRNLSTCPDAQVHLVVLGMTEMGIALVREAIRLAHPSGRGSRFLITLVDDNAREEMHYFIGRTKELLKRCRYSFTDYDHPTLNTMHVPNPDFLDVEFEFIQCDMAHPQLTENLIRWASDPQRLFTLAVCTDNSPKNMAVAMYLPHDLLNGEKAIPVWVYQNGDDSMKQLLDPEKYNTLHPFSLADHAVEDIATSEHYAPARTIASFYEKNYGDYRQNSWDGMPSTNRWSSIYNVMSMEIKLQAVGVDPIQNHVCPDDEQKKLCIDFVEHNRWMVEKLSVGYIPTNDVQHKTVAQELHNLLKQYPDWKDNGASRDEIENRRTIFKQLKNAFVHDDIRPFDELDEYTKWKDRIMLDGYLASMNQKNSHGNAI